MASLGKSGLLTTRSLCRIGRRSVTDFRNGVLSYKHLVTNRAMASLGKSGLLTSRSLCRIDNRIVLTNGLGLGLGLSLGLSLGLRYVFRFALGGGLLGFVGFSIGYDRLAGVILCRSALGFLGLIVIALSRIYSLISADLFPGLLSASEERKHHYRRKSDNERP